MGRKPRLHFRGAIFHVMARGVNGCPIYHDDDDRSRFLSVLRRVELESGAETAAYCLMGNHFHLAIKVGLVPLSTIMHRLLTAHSQRFNEKYGRQGHLFQARYKAVLCADDRYLQCLLHYIHQNPVRAGLVMNAGDWFWSSVHRYPEVNLEMGEFNPWPEDMTLLRQEGAPIDLNVIGSDVAEREGLSIEMLRGRTKCRAVVRAKRLVAVEAVSAGHSLSSTADWLGVSRTVVGRYCSQQIANRPA